jgi:hypothetical protein
VGSVRRRYLPCGTAAAGTTVVGTPANFNLNSGGLTVPALVTPAMAGLIVLVGANGAAFNPAPLGWPAGSSAVLLDDRPATNLRVMVFRAAGLTAGDAINFTGTGNVYGVHAYSSVWTPVDGTLSAGIRSGSSAVATSGSVAPATGGKVLVIGAERTVATPTVVQSVVPTSGETVTDVTFGEDTTTVASVYLGIYDAASPAARTVTITWDDASTNGYAAQLLASTPAGRRSWVAR